MKRIKLFFITFVCALCLCFAFAGCAAGDGAYVDKSFTTDFVNYSSYNKELYVSFSFKVKLPQAGEYTVEYDICQTAVTGAVIARETYTTTVTRSVDTDKSEYTIDTTQYITTSSSSTSVKIDSVKVTLDSAKKSSVPYAIGFGAAGGVLLCGLVVLFVLDKCGIFNKRK